MKRLLKKSIPLLTLLAVSGFTWNTVSANTDTQCSVKVDNILNSLEFTEKSIRNISVIDRIETHAGGSITTGTEHWVSFRECKGNLVLVLDRNCNLEETYTMGSCTIKDIPSY